MEILPGDVVQINTQHKRAGWVGAFVLVTETKTWGVRGFVHCIKTHNEHEQAHIRLGYEEIDRIGQAVMVPEGFE